jgi:hypothetical protein
VWGSCDAATASKVTVATGTNCTATCRSGHVIDRPPISSLSSVTAVCVHGTWYLDGKSAVCGECLKGRAADVMVWGAAHASEHVHLGTDDSLQLQLP